MYLIVGLGNPGLSYRRSRHNVGFMALDLLAQNLGVRVTKKGFSAVYGEGEVGDERVILLKPQTYMNLSGNAVQQAMHFYRLPLDRLVVLYDDIDLAAGQLRIRAQGSAGTHNGMRSIIGCMGGDRFPRIRIGVGKDETIVLRDYVLKKPTKAELEVLKPAFERAAEAAKLIVGGELDKAQARFNGNGAK
ncbi:MAG: aminoacyl-tRNA hydrolase [Clostridia bacterium]|nr:aminoacyl-tRNA hydrolase [Clostridia bacterium]